MNYTLENFIGFCDDYQIANEGSNGNKILATLQNIFSKLVSHITAKVKTMKDGKIKSLLLGLLQRANNGLAKCKSLNTYHEETVKRLQSEAKDINDSLKQMQNNQSSSSTSDKNAQVSEAFKDAVNQGNLRRVRIMLKDSMLVDPSLKMFHAREKYASSKLKELYVEHDGGEMIDDSSLWNDDYMNKMKVKLIYNFSRERVEHLKKVVRYLRPSK